MKNSLRRFFLMLGITISTSVGTIGFAQGSLNDFFNSTDTPVTWLGVDYSRAKYFGDQGTVDGYEMRDGFNKINKLILAESDKYDLRKAFKKNDLNVDIGYVLERNSHVNVDRIVSWSSRQVYRLTKDSITQIIKSYDLPKTVTGLGIVFICEAIDKNTERSTFYATCFDLKSKEVLFTEKVSGRAGGIGFRNHWARCVDDVLDKVGSGLFKSRKLSSAGG